MSRRTRVAARHGRGPASPDRAGRTAGRRRFAPPAPAVARRPAGDLFARYLAQRVSVNAAPATVVQLARIDHDAPDYDEKNGRAGKVDVANVRGQPYAEGHNNPTTDNVFGWRQLHAAGHTLGNPNSTHYNAVRMHLWNGRLAGPGDKEWNLAPGPALINSSMSAGPESAAKYAVETGKRIWLTTEVWYRNSGPDANDFTNVVPNRMKMEWGYMLTAGDQPAPRIDLSGTRAPVKRGAALPPAWEVPIDQPAGAMSEVEKGKFRDLKDDQTAELEVMYASLSNQEKAQAFEVLSPALKRHVILSYPEVYWSMAEASRAGVLTTLGVPDVLHLIQNVLNIREARRLIAEVYQPLIAAGHTARLQAIFKDSAPVASKDDQLIAGKWDLIRHLGDEVSWDLRSDHRYFRYVPNDLQPAVLNSILPVMMDSFLESFPGGTTRHDVFNNWAKREGHAKPSQWLAFIGTKVKKKWAVEYKEKLKWRLLNE